MVKRKSRSKKGEGMPTNKLLRWMVSSGLCESFQNIVHLNLLLYMFRAASRHASYVTTSNAVMQKRFYVVGCQSSQRLWIVYICIHVHFNSSHFSNGKKHSILEIWRTLIWVLFHVPPYSLTSSVASTILTAHMMDIFPCARYMQCCPWYMAWESNNKIEVANP